MRGTRGRRRTRRTAVLAVLAGAAASCSAGNQVGSMQVPALVSGLVTARAPCPPSAAACSFVVVTVPGAVVTAEGKDGTHQTRADPGGHYRLALLTGLWTLEARRATGAPSGAPVRVDLSAGRSAEVDLRVGD